MILSEVFNFDEYSGRGNFSRTTAVKYVVLQLRSLTLEKCNFNDYRLS